MDAFTFVLESLDDTARLGTLLAGMMQNAPQVRALLLQGDLGSGKTTLTRSLVAALPGGDQAEISSPASWNGPSISPKRPFPRNFWTSGWSHAKRDDS